MQDYIQQALRTESPINTDLLFRMQHLARQIHALMGLQTEVGELVDGYKRNIFYNAILDQTNLDEEIGDILWYLAILMDSVGINFEQCMGRNIAKLKSRYPDKFNETDAVERDLPAERAVLESKPTLHDVCNAMKEGWIVKEGSLLLPGDPSVHWAAVWHTITINGKHVNVPDWLNRRRAEIAAEEQKQEVPPSQERSKAYCKTCGSTAVRTSSMNPGYVLCNNCGKLS